MHETDDDLARLQACLDQSYAAAGAHLASIHTDAVRLTAEQLVDRLTGMRVLVVATVSRDGRPFTGPVDSFLIGGRFHFGTDAGALRTRHLAANDAVSATYVEGEGLVVTVHGRAQPVEHGLDPTYGQVLRQNYGPFDVDRWMADNPAWAIEPDRVFAADMSVHQQTAAD